MPAEGRELDPLCEPGPVRSEQPVYDAIGRSYSTTRREDPRIAAEIHACLQPQPVGPRPTDPSGSVINVGAGTGSYEPTDRVVISVEPSPEMLRQRTGRMACTVRGIAEALPFTDDTFAVGMAVLTIHHWANVKAGLRELRRVSRRQVVFYFEPLRSHDFWALEYFPDAASVPSEHNAPGESVIGQVLDVKEIRPVLVPHDCMDGFGAAFWARPEAYLDPEVQAGMSWLALLSEDARRRGSERLAADLESGDWDRRHGHLRDQSVYDGGYRIAIAE